MPASLSLPGSPQEIPLYQRLAAGGGRYAVRVYSDLADAPGLPLAGELFLYETAAQLALQSATHACLVLALEDTAAGLTVGWWPVVMAAGTAHSLSQAPFGGPHLLAADVPLSAVLQWIQAGEYWLKKAGAARCTLRLPALAYAPTVAKVAEALRLGGYAVAQAEINSHLPLAEAYEARLHPSERRRLHKCRRAGLHVEQEPALLLPLAYEFLNECRREKGQELSLPLERLRELFARWPDRYFLFSVRTPGGEWAALTVAVLAGNGVLYNFYPASPLSYNTYSPVVLLNAGLHAFAQASGLRLLDLGTSTLPSGLNASLLCFKRHLGGVPSLKLTFARKL